MQEQLLALGSALLEVHIANAQLVTSSDGLARYEGDPRRLTTGHQYIRSARMVEAAREPRQQRCDLRSLGERELKGIELCGAQQPPIARQRQKKLERRAVG